MPDDRQELFDGSSADCDRQQANFRRTEIKWHRVALADDAARGNKALNASYRGFIDGVPNGELHNFRGARHQWVGEAPDMSPAMVRERFAEIERNTRERDELRAKEQDDVARKAYGIYINAPTWASSENNAYLRRKQVRGYGVKLDNTGRLMIPLRDETGKLWNLQFVGDQKFYMEGGRKQGLFHSIDPERVLRGEDSAKGRYIFVAEGYATAAEIYEAAKEPVVVAFDKGNLLPVCEALAARFPGATLIVACDNDHHLENHPQVMSNQGIELGKAAAEQTGALYIYPRLDDAEKAKGLTDYNDLKAARGREALQTVLQEDVMIAMRRPNLQREQATYREMARELELAR